VIGAGEYNGVIGVEDHWGVRRTKLLGSKSHVAPGTKTASHGTPNEQIGALSIAEPQIMATVNPEN